MGGNALKNTKRMNKKEFIQTKNIALNKIYEYNLHAEVVRFYKDKQDFGDIDILVKCDNPVDVERCIDKIKNDLHPRETFKNGNVFSFELNNHQVDLIFTPEKYFTSSLIYFSYNDLFNFLGRIAHRLGFKLGHKGLMVVVKNGNYKLGEVILTQDLKEILGILGLSYQRYKQGFNTKEDIFNFVISSRFFNKSMFDYNKLNHINRIRNKKRKMYREFLEYIADKPLPNEANKIDKEEFVNRVLKLYPQAQKEIQKLQEKLQKQKEVSQIFNGHIVSEIKNVKGRELGKWMKHFKNKYDLDFWIKNKEQAREIIAKEVLE